MIGAIMAKKNVRTAIEAMNRRDGSALLKDWSDDAVWIDLIYGFLFAGLIYYCGRAEFGIFDRRSVGWPK